MCDEKSQITGDDLNDKNKLQSAVDKLVVLYNSTKDENLHFLIHYVESKEATSDIFDYLFGVLLNKENNLNLKFCEMNTEISSMNPRIAKINPTFPKNSCSVAKDEIGNKQCVQCAMSSFVRFRNNIIANSKEYLN